MINIRNLNKIYKSKKRNDCHALQDINLSLPSQGLIFVLGKSGSGKSTLLNLIGGLDSISSGEITVNGNNISHFSENKFADYRNTYIGYIFQDYHLIDELTVHENIKLSLELRNHTDDNLITEALECQNEMSSVEMEHAFINGFSLAISLLLEAISEK